jgi:S-adenosylmethionine:tRNA ribosyltransferase-isomerase
VEIPTYELPEAAIAQRPVEPRDAARMLDASDPAGKVVHRHVRDLPDLLGPGDVLVVNTSRVFPARLRLHKPTGGAAEVLLLEEEEESPSDWTALVRPGRRLPPGTLLGATPDGPALLEVGERLAEGRRRVHFMADAWAVVESWGTIALPPYIHAPLADPSRYQTVYADRPGSVAAPTAGLHLTEDVLSRCRARQVRVCGLDLAVGLATFKPVMAARAEEHRMHVERYRVPADTWDACRSARRVVAVGTTTVRALETAGATGALEGETDLFIRGDFPFGVVDALMTNFHMPRSTLLLMLESFCGPAWRALYETALRSGYRFLSFGDAMLVSRRPAVGEQKGTLA